MDQRDPQPGQQFSAPSYAPPQRTSNKPTVRRRTAIGIGIGALILGAGIGAAGKNNKTTDAAGSSATKATATVTATTTQTAPAPAAVTITAKSAAAAPAVTITKTETAPAPTSAAASGFSDGTYIVGTDIKPGLYKTTGPSDTGALSDCYWERDRDLAGGVDSIIDNDNAKGPTTVQISSSDKAFKTSGCAPWVKIG